MMNEKYIVEDLLVKYLLGEANPEEEQKVLHWINQSEQHKKHFEQLKLIWETSQNLNIKTTISEEDAWRRLQQRIQQEPVIQQKKSFLLPSSLRVAAGFLLLISLGVFYFLWSRSSQLVTLASAETVLVDTLSDGTVVTLNKHATLKYPEQFSGATRKVVLNGEAFFEVAPNKQKPFIITTQQSQIKVVGTSFNVKGFTKTTEVIVATGIVEVSKNSKAVLLHPNEMAVVHNNEAGIVKQTITDKLYNYYQSKEFVCNGTPLNRLVEVLNQVYDKEIIIENPQLKNLPLTATFRNESLDNILLVISETFNINITREDKKIILR